MCKNGQGREKEVDWRLSRLGELYEALETNQLPKLPNDPKLLSIAYSSTHVVALYEFTLRTFTISSNEITQSSITPIPSARKYTHIHSVQKGLFSLSTLTNTLLFDADKGTFYTGKDGGWAGDYCGTARDIIDTFKREWIHVGKGDRLWTISDPNGRIDVRMDKIEGISNDLIIDADVNISLCANQDVAHAISKKIYEENMIREMELQELLSEARSEEDKPDGQSQTANTRILEGPSPAQSLPKYSSPHIMMMGAPSTPSRPSAIDTSLFW